MPCNNSFAFFRAILHDERLFDNPHEFLPERYLDIKDEDTRRLLDPSTYMFGFGRRYVVVITMPETAILNNLTSEQ